jgi:transcriptional regulator NrdR family protein
LFTISTICRIISVVTIQYIVDGDEIEMQMEQVIVINKDKTIEAFDQRILEDSIKEVFAVSGKEMALSQIEMLTEEVIKKLQSIGNELYGEDIHYAVIDILEENGHNEEAVLYKRRKE